MDASWILECIFTTSSDNYSFLVKIMSLLMLKATFESENVYMGSTRLGSMDSKHKIIFGGLQKLDPIYK